MRISDWSSDVCSSDLAALSLGERLAGRTHTSRRLDSVAALATVVQVVTAFDARRRLAHAGMPERLEQQPAGRTLKVGEFVLAGAVPLVAYALNRRRRSEEHTSELQSLMSISYAVVCLTKKKNKT